MREFLLSPPSVLSGGTDRDVFVSVKARYVRNLDGCAFPGRLSGEDSLAVRSRVLDAIALIPGDRLVSLFETLPSAEAEALSERGYAEASEADDLSGVFHRALALGDGGREAFLVNGSDHLRVSAERPGTAVRDAFSRVKERDAALDQVLHFAASFDYGYLCAYPEDCGSGLRLSARAFLPGIIASGVFDRVSRDLLSSDIEPRREDDFFVSLLSRSPMGVDEELFVSRFESVLASLAEGERKTRERVLSRDRLQLEDAAFRAAALLGAARLLGAEEAALLLSRLRAGAAYGVSPSCLAADQFSAIDTAMLLSRPGHLKLLADQKNAANADELRCGLVRGLLPRYLI